jgi:Ala-tRNA(Pro) deacylase
MRVAQFLTDQHVAFETMVHPPAFTAQKRAKFLHIPGRHVIKCVLLASENRFFLAVLPATQQVDLEALASRLGSSLRLASEQEIAQHFRDCEYGALTPFGSLYGFPTLLEDAIDPESLIVFEAQRHAVAIRMRCRDFEMLERPTRCRFARASL